MDQECTNRAADTPAPSIILDHRGGDAVLVERAANGRVYELWQTSSAAELRQLAAKAAEAAQWLEARTEVGG